MVKLKSVLCRLCFLVAGLGIPSLFSFWELSNKAVLCGGRTSLDVFSRGHLKWILICFCFYCLCLVRTLGGRKRTTCYWWNPFGKTWFCAPFSWGDMTNGFTGFSSCLIFHDLWVGSLWSIQFHNILKLLTVCELIYALLLLFFHGNI